MVTSLLPPLLIFFLQPSPASVLCVFCVLSLLQSRERQDRARPRDGGDAYQCLCVWVWGCVLPLPWRRHYHRRTSLWSHPLQNLNACGRTLVEGADSLSKWLQIILKVSICNRGYKNTEKADENCYNSVLTWTLATFIDFKMKTNNVPVCSLLRPVMSSTWLQLAEPAPVDSRAEIPNFRAEINIFSKICIKADGDV